MKNIPDDPDRGDLMAAACPSRDDTAAADRALGMLVCACWPAACAAGNAQIHRRRQRADAGTRPCRGLRPTAWCCARDFQTVPPHVDTN